MQSGDPASRPLPRLGSMNHIRLTVTDIPRAEAFYGAILGFMSYRLVEKSDTRLAWTAMTPGGSLQWVIVSLADTGRADRPHDRYAPGLHHFAWNADSRDQVDRFHELLHRIGAAVLDPPAEYDYEPGYYAVFFLDPDGMKLELVHVPEEGSSAYWAKAGG
jgi:catechol 2,3-dioxygenase-like lactoylglutathione lyase family enzyme